MANEIKIRPARAMADWASHALTVGYCLRKLEEEENGNPPMGDTDQTSPEDVGALDKHSSDLVERLRNETGNDFLLYPEDLVIDALDRVIYGEIDRRLSHYAEKLDPESFEELESYIGWWTLKGYCLRVAEQLVGAEGETPHIDS